MLCRYKHKRENKVFKGKIEYLYDFGVHKNFLDTNINHKGKNDHLGYVKLKNLFAKDTLRKRIGRLQSERRYLQYIYLIYIQNV